MKVTINGATQDVRGPSLADVLSETGLGDAKVATAVNEAFVPAGLRATHLLAADDRIEIVAPKQGG